MDAEARWFYAVGLSAMILAALGLLVRALGAAIPAWAVVLILLIGIVGAALIVLSERHLLSRYRAWRASRPKAWPAGWKMEKRSR
jgi:hypothetical protein